MAQKINYEQLRYGTKDGELKFGHLTADNQIDAVLGVEDELLHLRANLRALGLG